MKIHFKIKNGSHYCQNWLMRIVYFLYKCVFINTKSVTHSITFTPSCQYKIANDDINKLYGYSIGFNHMETSIRFGWRNNNTQTIEIFAFYQIGGIFKYRKICDVQIGKEYRYVCAVNKKDDHYFYALDVFDGETNIGTYKSYLFTLKNKIHFSYGLIPYFGGELPAPKNMEIIFG